MLILRIEEDRFIFDVPAVLRDTVVDLARQLDQELETDNPNLQRLFPTAYSSDPDKDAGYQVLARGELIESRRTSLTAVIESVDHDEVDDETLRAWMRVVNDLRLVLGTNLDVGESEDWQPASEMEPTYVVYQWLSLLLSHIVEAQF
ncbi:MAG: DUF2017 domain-containing protein [Acidimicrobiia bacterium]|nr:DUF2017 domain-containing protein [Acidimicrobiia bacterium]